MAIDRPAPIAPIVKSTRSVNSMVGIAILPGSLRCGAVSSNRPKIAWVTLENRHQLDNCDSEIFQIWDLLYQTRIGSGPRRIDTRVVALRETLHVKFVNDCIRLVMQRPIPCPVKNWTMRS